ncbi:DMT family transporter [Vibrio amylolyticus]|uniref:DMT family transporter n=1 Tax=Vibrio amylolyticus TaxID=2847292 RepID=UPI00355294B6
MAGIILIMIAASLWAADTLIRYPLLENNSTLQIVFFEHVVLIAIAIAIQLLLPKHRFRYIKGSLFAFMLIGVFGSAIGTLAFTKAFTLMNPTLVILLQKLQPIIAISLSVILLKEKLQRHFIIWASVSLVGSVIMIAPDILTLTQQSTTWYYNPEIMAIILGYASALIAVIAWGSSIVYGKKLSLMGYSTLQIMTGRFSVAFVTLCMLMLGFNESFVISKPDFTNLIFMVLLSGLFGMYLYYRGLATTPARYATIAELFFPVAAVIINWVAFDVELTKWQFVGAGLLIGGTLMLSRESSTEDHRQASSDPITTA